MFPDSPPDVASTDEAIKSSTTHESTVFNKPEDSDIIIEYHGIKVHAHRANLRMCSPFFERIFQSRWPVAKGPVPSFGDDDDPKIVDAMLRHMYNLPYSESLEPTSADNVYKVHFDVFMLADKYDCPSLRQAAVSNFRRTADKSVRKLSHYYRSTNMLSFIEIIPHLCGTDARPTADSSLRNKALKFCVVNYTKLFELTSFREQLKDGNMFDEDAMVKLLGKIGAIALRKQAQADSTNYVRFPVPSNYSDGPYGRCLVPDRYPTDEDLNPDM